MRIRNIPDPPFNSPKRNYVKWSWITNYYDGPLAGLVTYPSTEFIAGIPVRLFGWAECFEENNGFVPFYRRYLLVDPNPTDLHEIFRHRDLFQKHVGAHWSFDSNGVPLVGEAKPRSEHHKYYDQRDTFPQKIYESGTIIGWFEI